MMNEKETSLSLSGITIRFSGDKCSCSCRHFSPLGEECDLFEKKLGMHDMSAPFPTANRLHECFEFESIVMDYRAARGER
jgi:hypothetical protein